MRWWKRALIILVAVLAIAYGALSYFMGGPRDVYGFLRSGIAAEDEHERALADAFTQQEFRLSIQCDELYVRRAVANAQITAMPVRQRVPHPSVAR